ncbi:MAG: hypothetical protein ABI207_06360 [Crocinitomicaceae bacterium]
MRPIKKLQILLPIIFLITIQAFGQKKNKRWFEKALVDTLSDYQAKWTYFKLADTIEVTIIEHFVAGVGCGSRASASLTIAKTATDTIRVLELCNTDKKFDIGQMVKVAPSDKPNFFVSIPLSVLTDTKGRIIMIPGKYELSVTKTTYGTILPK